MPPPTTTRSYCSSTGRPLKSKNLAFAGQLMRDLEGSRMAAAQTGQSRRIIARRLGPKLGERSKSGGNGQSSAAQEIAARNIEWHCYRPPVELRNGVDDSRRRGSPKAGGLARSAPSFAVVPATRTSSRRAVTCAMATGMKRAAACWRPASARSSTSTARRPEAATAALCGCARNRRDRAPRR
jgi:hypothetical protein